MKLFKYTAISSVLLIALTGCGGGSDSTDTATAKFNLGVSDAAIDDVSSVVVAYNRVVLLPQGSGSAIEFDLSTDDNDGQLIDLLEYQGSQIAPLLTDEEIPVGDYKLCLFAIDGDGQDLTSHVMVGDPGALTPLQVKGDGACPTIGKEDNAGVLYFNKSFTVNAGNNSFVTEFELRRGLKEPTGKDDFYTIQRTSIQLINNTEAGNITGAVDANIIANCISDEESISAVYVYSGDVALEDMAAFNEPDEGAILPIASADVNENEDNVYEYEVAFLGEGTYSLGYTCQAEKDEQGDDFDSSFVVNKDADALVTANEAAEVNFVE